MDVSSLPGCRAARKADRRRTILDVAERSFRDRGFGDTSMSTIAAQLGGSKTTLWSYFPSKEALFTAVIDEKIEAFQATLDQALISTGGTAATLDRFGHAYLNKIGAPDAIALHRLIVAESERFPEIGEAFAVRGPSRARSRLCQYMEEEMSSGRLRRGDPLIAAQQFIALCQAGSYVDRLWCPSRIFATLDADVAAAVDTFLRAWGPDAA